MAPKPKAAPKPKQSRGNPFKNRMALGEYLEDPASWPSSIVVHHTDDFVAIHDKYAKATIHTLLLPRSAKHNLMHPFDAFDDADFLAKVRAATHALKDLVAKELQRRLGPHSAADARRQAILDGEADPDPDSGGELPAGRDWGAEIICGVHAVPSMSHLHVHVLSRDMHAGALKHRKHYNSFATPFLVDIDDFPLREDDPRRDTKEEGYLRRDLVCWRCGRNFGNQFQRLKEHLDEEFGAWKRL